MRRRRTVRRGRTRNRTSNKRKHKVMFSNKYHPVKGIWSAVIGGVCLIIMVFLFMVSGAHRGSSATWVGVAGFWTLGLSIAGFVLGTKSYRMDVVYMITPMLGSILNGVVMLVLIVLYVAGMV